MVYKFLTIIFVIVFYIVRLPIVLTKDIILAIYSAFDVSRFLDTYQNALSNFIAISSISKRTLEHNLILDSEEIEDEEEKTVGFKTYQTGLPTPQSPSESGMIYDD